MKQKFLGGLNLLIFVFTAMACPLVVIENANADYNVVYDRTHTKYYICQYSRNIGYKVVNENVEEAEWYHPADTYDTEGEKNYTCIPDFFRGPKYQAYPGLPSCWRHTSHNVTYNDLTTSEYIEVSRYHWSCR